MKAAEIFKPRIDAIAGYLGATCRWCGVWFDHMNTTEYASHADMHVDQGELERYLTIGGPEYRAVFGKVPLCMEDDTRDEGYW